ncbi:MAG: 50S ribosomal protein L40e [archaeon]|jgi:ribosomal protein L40E|nr:50S ribosomal protein L40e [Candidatus Paceibacterota bacterium]MDP6704034.1 50S ribosomal protein L40e [archaeon]MDP7260445.1 50S ribosomal protein L40e [archaeon]HIK01418.1 50S ribosomal protein L40e [Candidatus Undinarchaeales archaeon ERR594346 U_76725]HIK01862.1 50S ribosomal protein L40e [Candidatus Undinarchaeales archaeon SRR5007147.bin71]
MAKFPEAMKALFDNVYICMNCNATNRVDIRRFRLGKAKCRECKRKQLRPKKRGNK